MIYLFLACLLIPAFLCLTAPMLSSMIDQEQERLSR